MAGNNEVSSVKNVPRQMDFLSSSIIHGGEFCVKSTGDITEVSYRANWNGYLGHRRGKSHV